MVSADCAQHNKFKLTPNTGAVVVTVGSGGGREMLAACLLVLSCLTGGGLSSWGDQSSYYQLCLQHCTRQTCSQPAAKAEWMSAQSLVETVVGVSCPQDCSYHCMWQTVEEMEARHGQIPQFHGKWPFVRVWGLQEPASVLFSVLNLLTNLWMLVWFRGTVPSNSPMYGAWVFYSLTAINAWVWSTVFHTRDTDITEMLDYFSAFSTVLASLLVCCLRMVGTDNIKAVIITALCVAFFSNHVYNMAFVSFDYGYNMKVNVGVGVLNGLAWLAWAYTHYQDGPHVKRGVLTILCLSLGVLLELLDFPPLLWVLDSHALWHLTTVPLPLLWYRFAAGDCLKLARDGGHDEKKIL